MHLVVVTPYPPSITGIGQYGYHITRALSQTNSFSKVTVLAGARKIPREALNADPLDVQYCWQPDRGGAHTAIVSRLRKLSPDVVWFNLGASVFGKSSLLNLYGLCSPWMARRMGLPTVVTLHELMPISNLRALGAPGGIFASLGARLLTRIATQADVVCLTMREYADWLAARRVDSMHIPIGAYHEPELLEQTSAPELLFFTTMAPFKGLEILLQSIDGLRAEFPGLRLTVAGTEHTRFPGYGRELRAKYNGDHGVEWYGEVPENQVMDLFRRAQIVMLPYTASSGSSSVLYQAATWGRAVIASDLVETRALAQAHDLRIDFFKNGDAASLRLAIRQLLASPERRTQEARHNFESIQRLQPLNTSARYIEAFNRALSKHKPSKRVEPAPRQFEVA